MLRSGTCFAGNKLENRLFHWPRQIKTKETITNWILESYFDRNTVRFSTVNLVSASEWYHDAIRGSINHCIVDITATHFLIRYPFYRQHHCGIDDADDRNEH